MKRADEVTNEPAGSSSLSPSAQRLSNYLSAHGILACNLNPYLPALDDIGCSWSDAMALIDSHRLFYCKAFRQRTSYLSPEAYFLLKQCRKPRPMEPGSQAIYELLLSGPPLDTKALKLFSCLPPKEYTKAFSALLEALAITALGSGQTLNPNWSTLVYSTADAWEAFVPAPSSAADPAAVLWHIFSSSMLESDFVRLVGSVKTK